MKAKPGAEMPLFGETDDERRKRLLEEQKTAEALARLEEKKARLFERLAEVGEKQKALAREVYAVEKEQRERLKVTTEHVVAKPEPLTHEDVERWAESVYWSYARTAPANPHKYVSKKRCESGEMYERIVRHVLENGYRQDYGGSPYTVYDLDIHGEPHFCWAMTDDPKQSEVFNAKPSSMRPE